MAERARRNRRRHLVGAAKVVAGVGAVVALGWLVAASPLFRIDAASVEVDGLSAEVDESALRAVIAGVDGDSLVTLNAGALEDRLAGVAGVREAKVEKSWPDDLRVTVVARRPVLAVPGEGGFSLLDADGVVVGSSVDAPVGLVVATVPVGEKRIVDAVVTVVRAMPAELWATVVAVSAQTEDSMVFTCASGLVVEWGGPEDSALKAQVVEAMIASGAVTGGEVLNVAAPTLPITKPAG